MAEPVKTTDEEKSRKNSRASDDGRTPPPPLPPKPADLPQIGGVLPALGRAPRPPPVSDPAPPPPSRPPPPPVCSPRPSTSSTATPPLPVRHRSSSSRPPAAEPDVPGPSDGTLTASNDSLNSAFTDSSDRNSQKAIPPDFEVDPPSCDDDSGAAAVQELSPNNDSSFARDAADDDEGRDLPPWQTSVETAENEDAAEEESSSKENSDTSAASIDDQAQTSANCEVQSTSLENVDDVTGPHDDVEKLESNDTVPENTDTDPDPAGEVSSPVDDASTLPNVDKPSAVELVDEEDGDEEIDKEAWGRLSQREDSGIVNAEVQTPRSSGDQPLSSSSSGDGEVTVLREAQVIVHVSADATSTDKAQSTRSSRRRPSADSTDRYRLLSCTSSVCRGNGDVAP